MSEPRIFYFACKPGCEPVQVSGKTAHARLPWVGRGYEVFEWHWFEEWRVAQMLIDEQKSLYELCGVDLTVPPFVVLNPARVMHEKVVALIAPQVAPDLYGVRAKQVVAP